MKVCLICHPAYPVKGLGGRDRYCYELLSYIKKIEGLQPIVLASFPPYHFLDWLGGEVFLMSKIRVKADLYHAIDPLGAKNAVLAKKFPLVTTIHDLNCFFLWSHKPTYKYVQICHKLSIMKSNKIVTSSQFIKKSIISILKVPSQKVKVIKHGVDHKFFHPLPKTCAKEKRILFIGGGLEVRGAKELMKAFSIVKRKLKSVNLLIAGKISTHEELKKFASMLKIKNYVRFMGFLPERLLPNYYNLADVYVWPSYRGFGLSILEAMACGTPLIAFDTLDTPEYVGEAGILVSPGDTTRLANAMLKVLTDEKLRANLSEKGICRAKFFSWEKMAKETVNAYYEVLRKENNNCLG